MQLVIGNKRYSSWSFRPWILMKVGGIPFTERFIAIHEKRSIANIRKYSPGGRVPALLDGKVKLWESLAICEYLAEKYPQKQFWPESPEARAIARSISHEMHAGFQDLRQNLTCHFVNRFRNHPVTPGARTDIQRILEIWSECRKRWGKGGPFLFGKFGVADAMYAPVVYRFLAYGVKVSPTARAYMSAVESLPAAREWVTAGALEKQRIPAYEKSQYL